MIYRHLSSHFVLKLCVSLQLWDMKTCRGVWETKNHAAAHTARKIHNKSTIVDCKLFSQSHCRELLYLPRPPHLWFNAHCTRNIVTTQLQYCFVNYLHNILGTMVQYFLQCGPHGREAKRGEARRGMNWIEGVKWAILAVFTDSQGMARHGRDRVVPIGRFGGRPETILDVR